MRQITHINNILLSDITLKELPSVDNILPTDHIIINRNGQLYKGVKKPLEIIDKHYRVNCNTYETQFTTDILLKANHRYLIIGFQDWTSSFDSITNFSISTPYGKRTVRNFGHNGG